jgi:aspartate aminotransferase
MPHALPETMLNEADILARVRPDVRVLPRSLIGEIADYGRDRPGLTPLWFGESDQPTPEFIIDAAAEAMRAGYTKYGYKRGDPELRQTLADYMTRLYGVEIGFDRISVTASGMSAIMLTMQALIEPGREVAIVTPEWPNAGACVAALGGRVTPVPLDCDPSGPRAGRWSLDLDALLAVIDREPVAVFINSPNNPTGWTMTSVEMAAVLERARQRGVWIVSDEVYARIVYPEALSFKEGGVVGPEREAAPSFLEIARPDDRLIVINSFSKTWSMTGWRLGWLTLPPAIGPILEKMNEFNTSGAVRFVERAAIAAVRDGEPYVAALRAQLLQNRALIQRRLGQLPGVRCASPDAAFYAFIGVDGETESLALAKRVVDEASVGLAPGAAFGPAGEGYLRLCFASAPETLDRALDRLIPVLTAAPQNRP